MSEYGYIPESPAQSWGSNKGIFSPNDIYDLTRDDKFTDYGQLDLIQTLNPSGVTQVKFEDMQENKYNVHLITYSLTSASDDTIITRLRTGGSYVSTGYAFASQWGSAAGTFSEVYGTGQAWLSRAGDATGSGSNERSAGFIYCYNLGDSTKYSFITFQHSGTNNSGGQLMHFGSAVYPTANVVDGFMFFGYFSANITGTASLYGIKAY